MERTEAGTVSEDENLDNERQQILIVTGMSGAGRSTACKALEDLDWFVVDNLPPQMIDPLIEVAAKARDSLPKLAVAVDPGGVEPLDHGPQRGDAAFAGHVQRQGVTVAGGIRKLQNR